jgi:hypothetical protein
MKIVKECYENASEASYKVYRVAFAREAHTIGETLV